MSEDRKKLYEGLMRRIDHANKKHQEIRREVKTAKFAEWGLNPKDARPDDHLKANVFAYGIARPYSQIRYELLVQLFEMLPFEEMEQGNTEAIDNILDFLEIDIPAFRCGYSKQWYYRHLKRVALTKIQQQRLLNIALELCCGSGWRKELAYLRRLVTKFADAQFIGKLQKLTDSEDQYTRAKAQRFLYAILLQRHDLA